MKIPRWLPPVVFGGLTLILFREFIVSGGMLYGGDTLALGYMARDFLGQALTESGTFPLWNPIILGGTPFIESLAGGDSLYPTSLLLILMETHRALGWKLIIHVFLAGIFMFGWVRVLGRSRSAALLAGVAYTLAPFMVTQVYPGADGKLFVTALAPLLFWVAEWSLVRRGLLPFVVVALVIGLVILTTHFQMAYFLFGAVGLYYVFRIVRLWRAEGKGGRGSWMSGPLGKLSLFLLAALLGAALAAVQLLPAVDYVTEHSRRTATTTRASDDEALAYSSSFALHPEEVAGLVVPEFVGGTLRRIGGDDDPAWTDRTYWGRNPLKYNSEYAGIVVLLLAGIAFLGAPRRGLRWFFAGLGALSILFGLGTHTPVWRIFYEIIPGISLFRAPSQAAFLFGFSAVTLMAFGFDRAVEAVQRALGGRDGEGWHRISLYLWSAVGAFGLLLLMAASGTLSSLWTTIFFRDIDPARAQLLTSVAPVITRGALIAFGLVAGTVSLWWAFRRGLFRPPLLLAGVGLLIAIDLLRVDAPFIQTFEFQRWAEPNANIRFLLERQKEEPPFRVLSLTDGAQDVKPGMYGLELAGGHHPNDLGRYRELIGMTGSGSPRHFVENSKLRALLNIGYLIWPDAQMRSSPQGAEPLSQVSQGGQVVESVYRTAALPRAYLVGEAIVVPDDEAVDFMLGDGFDPSVQVVLSEEPPIELPGGTVTGDVRWEERGLNHQRLVVRASQPALLVISDNWFSSWRARIDGEAQPLLRADHALRAVPIPEGEHSVELYYDGSELRKGLILSGFTLFLLLVTGGLPVRLGPAALPSETTDWSLTSDGGGEPEQPVETIRNPARPAVSDRGRHLVHHRPGRDRSGRPSRGRCARPPAGLDPLHPRLPPPPPRLLLLRPSLAPDDRGNGRAGHRERGGLPHLLHRQSGTISPWKALAGRRAGSSRREGGGVQIDRHRCGDLGAGDCAGRCGRDRLRGRPRRGSPTGRRMGTLAACGPTPRTGSAPRSPPLPPARRGLVPAPADDAPRRAGDPGFIRPRWLALYSVNWLVYVTAFALMVRSLGIDVSVFFLGPAFAAAYVLGYLVLFAPAGMGPREGFLIAFLEPLTGAAAALLVAVVARVWMTFLELAPALLLGGSHLAGRGKRVVKDWTERG